MAETTVLRSSAINRTPNGGAKPQAQLSGALPVVHVNMNSGGPKVQGGQQVRQGVQILPPKAGTRNFTTGGLPNQPAKQGVVILPPKEQRAALTADQLLLCRHLADKYLGELRASTSEVEVEGVAVDQAAADHVKFAEAMIVTIDVMMAAMTAAAAKAAAAAAAPPPPRVVAAGPRQVAASAAPRRVSRPAPPPVIVKMDADRPIPVQGDADPTETPIDMPQS